MKGGCDKSILREVFGDGQWWGLFSDLALDTPNLEKELRPS
jgi:hypothetical protein